MNPTKLSSKPPCKALVRARIGDRCRGQL